MAYQGARRQLGLADRAGGAARRRARPPPRVVAAAPVALGASSSHPQIPVGAFPTGIALDPATDTIYVGNGTTGTLSVIDGRSCNAESVRGCNRHVVAATAGVDPIGIAIDPTTKTLY